MPAKPTKNQNETRRLVVAPRIAISLDEFSFSYSRSSGPGGQNVNKVNTKVRLSWHVTASHSISDAVKNRFLERFRRRINSDGIFQITSQRYRDQDRNREDCLEKLRELLVSVASPPKPRKRTKPTRGSIERRLDKKRRRSSRKQSRRRIDRDD